MSFAYPIAAYGRMVSDAHRTEPYARALRRAIRPGSVVVDLGAGTGFFSVLAVRYGARRVFALDSPEVLAVAKAVAEENECSDRITFVAGDATTARLPERADVLVADLRGILPFFSDHREVLPHCRSRFLKPRGILIPSRDTLWVAPVEDPSSFTPLADPGAAWDVRMRRSATLALSSTTQVFARPSALLGAARPWFEIDYGTVNDPNAAGRFDLRIRKAGTLHGLSIWFSTKLLGGIGFTNAPGAGDATYGQTLLPLPRSEAVRRGDRLRGDLTARHMGRDYLWRWRGTLTRRSGTTRLSFDQSTFRAEPPAALLPPATKR